MTTAVLTDSHRRCVARLAKDRSALRALRDLGVTDDVVDRYQLGLAAQQMDARSGMCLRRCIRFPIMGPVAGDTSGYGALPLAGITILEAATGTPGRRENPVTYWSRPHNPDATIRVMSSVADLWRAAGLAADGEAGPILIAPSHDGGPPVEWRAPAFWRRFRRVEINEGVAADLMALIAPFATQAAPASEREPATPVAEPAARTVPPPSPDPLITASSTRFAQRRSETVHARRAAVGSLACTVIDGFAYYSFPVERIDRGASSDDDAVYSYGSLTLRSDGDILRSVALPFPPGTPPHGRVHALSDGTRVSAEAVAGGHATWSEAGIRRFVAARQAGVAPCRPAGELFGEVELAVRVAVDLPDEDAYAVVTAFIMLTHVFRAFEALPVLLACGPPQSGKSELANVVASLGFNAVLVGQATTASVTKLCETSGGLVVLDDCDRLGGGGVGSDDLRRLLRVGYKASTARKSAIEPSGRVRIVDLFGPRMLTNVSGADDALLSRMVVIATRATVGMSEKSVTSTARAPHDLRDDLHAWGFASVTAFQEDAEKLGPFADRTAEITAPLLAIARTVGGDVEQRISAAIGSKPAIAAVPTDEEVVDRALHQLAAAGVGAEVAMSRVAMEVALAADEAGVPAERALASPEWLGGRLAAAGLRDADAVASRRRMMGAITRIYPVSSSWREAMSAADGDNDPLAFCRESACPGCRYRSVCERISPVFGARRRRAGVPE